MRIDIATLFPQMCSTVFSESIVGRGIKNGYVEIYAHDIRDFTQDKHNRVDDKPYGGGTGMVMQAQPIYDCVKHICAQHKTPPRIIYLSPQGEVLTQTKVKQLAAEDGLVLLCGHYEGVDQRVLDELGAEEISVGDYVLTGGELPALIIADAVARLQKGVLPNEDAYSIESHEDDLLEYPQYTMPREWRGREVPQPLTTGDHKVIAEWQHKQALRVTHKKRPDMYRKYMDRAFDEFWGGFLAAKGISGARYDEICFFGSSEAESETQLKLIRRGKKRAAVSPCAQGAVLPKKGQLKIVVDWDGAPNCVVKTTGVKVVRLCDITAEQMQRECGGDIDSWQENKRAEFIANAEKTGVEYSEDMKIIYEEFRLEYKGK